MKIPEILYKPRTVVSTIIVIPLFLMLFTVVYTPTFGHEGELSLINWTQHSSFCISIICAITLGVVALSRIGFFFYVRYNDHFNAMQYLMWQVVEFVCVCLFVDLFLSLYFDRGFFELMSTIFLYGALILVFPYVILWLFYNGHDKELKLAAAEQHITDLQQGLEKNEPGAVKFIDDKGNVKLIVGANRIIYIEAAANYVNIVYENSGKLVRFSLRNTLKGIEAACAANDLVRCHRSYFINLHKVKLLRRDPDSLYAEMDTDGVDDIPISKSYANEVVRLFNA